jgi:hypothetical protein
VGRVEDDARGGARGWHVVRVDGDMWVRTKVHYALPGELTGSELPVKVDPADPQKVVVDWDAAAAEARPQ